MTFRSTFLAAALITGLAAGASADTVQTHATQTTKTSTTTGTVHHTKKKVVKKKVVKAKPRHTTTVKKTTTYSVDPPKVEVKARQQFVVGRWTLGVLFR